MKMINKELIESSRLNSIKRLMLTITGAILILLGVSQLFSDGFSINPLFGLICGSCYLLFVLLPEGSFSHDLFRFFLSLLSALFIIAMIFFNPPEALGFLWLFPYMMMLFFLFTPSFSFLFCMVVLVLVMIMHGLSWFGLWPAVSFFPLVSALRLYAVYIISLVILYLSSRLYAAMNEGLEAKHRELEESFEGTRLLSQELEVSRHNYMEIIRKANDGILLVQDGKIVFCNNAFMTMGGYTSAEVLGYQYSGFFNTDAGQEAIKGAEIFSLDEESDSGAAREAVLKSKEGQEIAVETTIGCIEYYGRDSLLVFVKDVRARRLSEERLKYLAYYDELTSLLNRKSFYSRIDRVIDLGKRRNYIDTWALLYIDLDNFKDINDSLGHGAGDQVLVEVGRRLCNSVRDSDDIFRIAGDEFAVLLGTISAMTDAGYVARKILHALAEPFLLEEREVNVTASIGVSVFPKDGTETDILIKNADMAMYEAKKHKNRYHFFDELLDRELEKRIEVSRDLRKALEEDQFCLYYQPIVDPSGTVVSAEALIRWLHPQKGLLAPGYFLKIAEEIGFIKEIEKWVIQSVCSQIRIWLDKGLDVVPVSLNITPFLLSDPNFLTYFVMYTERYSVSSRYLKVEITESSSMSNPDDVRRKMELLAAEGFTILIDDFGTGYSSLAYLKRFPAQTLKIDRSFIFPIPDDKDASLLVASIVALAHNLGFSVIAEGVETDAQNSYLTEISCDLQQGYLYSPPVPADDFEELLIQVSTGPIEI